MGRWEAKDRINTSKWCTVFFMITIMGKRVEIICIENRATDKRCYTIFPLCHFPSGKFLCFTRGTFVFSEGSPLFWNSFFHLPLLFFSRCSSFATFFYVQLSRNFVFPRPTFFPSDDIRRDTKAFLSLKKREFFANIWYSNCVRNIYRVRGFTSYNFATRILRLFNTFSI